MIKLILSTIAVIAILFYLYLEFEINRELERELYVFPFGRFGNNIIQLNNAIKLGLQTGCKKITFLDKTIHLPKSKSVKDYSFIAKMNRFGMNYFYIDRLKKIYPNFDETIVNQEKVRNILLKYCFDKYKFVHSTYLCIHIRSGDIFDKLFPHGRYIQPPYSFYKMILELKEFSGKPVVLITENKKNPNVRKILENYDNVFWEKNTLKRDQEIILNSKYIVFGYGTFVPQLLYLSYGKKNAIRFQDNKISLHNYNDGFSKVSSEVIVNNYITHWKNTDEQRNIMLNFNIDMNCDKASLKKLINNFTKIPD